MKNFPTRLTLAFAPILLLLFPFLAYGAGIDDILNQQPATKQVSPGSKNAMPQVVVPYNTQDVLKISSDYLIHNEKNYEVWDHMTLIFDVQRADAFNKTNFGSCDEFYPLGQPQINSISKYRKGEELFFKVLDYASEPDERNKADDREGIKNGFLILARIANSDSRCHDQTYTIRLKELFDTIIQAGPTILAEKQRATAENIKSHQVAEQQSQAKASASLNEALLANKKVITCQNTNQYRAYVASDLIVKDQGAISVNQGIIDRQNEGAKSSGFVDKQQMYIAGTNIANYHARDKETFKTYKQNGGSASSVESVQRLANPCANM